MALDVDILDKLIERRFAYMLDKKWLGDLLPDDTSTPMLNLGHDGLLKLLCVNLSFLVNHVAQLSACMEKHDQWMHAVHDPEMLAQQKKLIEMATEEMSDHHEQESWKREGEEEKP